MDRKEKPRAGALCGRKHLYHFDRRKNGGQGQKKDCPARRLFVDKGNGSCCEEKIKKQQLEVSRKSLRNCVT